MYKGTLQSDASRFIGKVSYFTSCWSDIILIQHERDNKIYFHEDVNENEGIPIRIVWLYQ